MEETTHPLDFNPAEFELMPVTYDNIFKEIITAGWAMSSQGDVEAPTGFFAIVEILDSDQPGIPGGIYEELLQGWYAPEDCPPVGIYFTREDSNGLIFVCKARDFRTAKKEYNYYLDLYSKYYGLLEKKVKEG